MLFDLVKPLLHTLDPEMAHGLTIKALKTGLLKGQGETDDQRLKVNLWQRSFPNPLGLAAGFDKNAEVIAPMLRIGFGFVEAGTVTPRPQDGNPRPRVFRDATHEAVINRMGFPSQGMDVFKQNIEKFLSISPRPNGIVGLNIGMNKGQKEPAKDYCQLVRALGPYADYFTINISSPNTPGLRNLQSRENFIELIGEIVAERKRSCGTQNPPPLLVKLAPDLNDEQIDELAKASLEAGIDGLILTNTTLDRPDYLPVDFSTQQGGLSGEPLCDKSTEVIGKFYRATDGKLPIIGVGGISSAQDAYDKIRAGASLVQLYSALIFHGPELVTEIKSGLLRLMARDGVNHISDAVGVHSKASPKAA
jgi:dihydroorotate dehydrogenase